MDRAVAFLQEYVGTEGTEHSVHRRKFVHVALPYVSYGSIFARVRLVLQEQSKLYIYKYTHVCAGSFVLWIMYESNIIAAGVRWYCRNRA